MNTNNCLTTVMASLIGAAGCGVAPPARATNQDGGTADGGTMMVAPTGGGTCDRPIELATAGTRMGADLVYRGTTSGRADALHPYAGCVMTDGAEAVMTYRVPMGSRAIQITTEGSSFDTAVYVRTHCSQAAAGVDLACNNDSFEHAPHSSVFVTNAVEGQVLFIVVDANVGSGPAGGAFVLTLRDLPFGELSTPCRPMVEGSTAALCDSPLRCSEGAADGTAICVPSMAVGQVCDPRGFLSACGEGLSCVNDPPGMEDGPMTAMCRSPGTHLGAPCRTTEPRCDNPMSCAGAMEALLCVPVIALGLPCDPAGEANRCSMGATCSPLGSGGPAICH